jgi:hypothetical protein
MICAHEFNMADEAFALSPISARAAQPREEDYDAISAAFMETSRGRWFLGEYARRNRNADTSMVLDAVARIEETLAAQRQPVKAESGLAEALVAIRSALTEARAAASATLDGLALEQHLAPVRKGARIIREISWRWREIGADGRICDLLDSQVSAIETGCAQISLADPQTALSAAFDLVEARITALGGGDEASPPAAVEEVVVSPAPSDELAAATENAGQSAPPIDSADLADSAQALPAQPAVAAAEAGNITAAAETAEGVAEAVDVADQAVDMTAQIVEVTDEAAEVTAETTEVTAAAADAEDEAVLEMVAFEMATDPFDADDAAAIDVAEIQAEAPPSAEPDMVVVRPEPVDDAPAQPPTMAPSPQNSLQPSLEPSPEPSLGSSLIESGIVRRPQVAGADPLAPIRRLSQAEKIALFS